MTKCPPANALVRMASLEKNPDRKGTPEMASAPTRKTGKVTGRRFLRPPMRRMSCSPPRAWMTLPAARNSRLLKKAWVTRWNMPAA